MDHCHTLSVNSTRPKCTWDSCITPGCLTHTQMMGAVFHVPHITNKPGTTIELKFMFTETNYY